jgi:hypothetical protein
MGTVALLTAYTTAGDPVVPAAVLNTTCLNADALECLCGAPSCLRWYLVSELGYSMQGRAGRYYAVQYTAYSI